MRRRYCNGMVHVIKQGETLYQLSRRYRVPLPLILRANPYVDVYNLQVGQEICIPVVRPFNGMICMPVQNMDDGAPRMTDDGQGQMSAGNEQEMPQETMMQESVMQESVMQESEVEMEEIQKTDGCSCQSEVFEQEEDDRENDDDDVEIYITSGDKSLGDILKEYGVDWEDFVRKNNLSQIVISEDVVLYLPKKHKK